MFRIYKRLNSTLKVIKIKSWKNFILIFIKNSFLIFFEIPLNICNMKSFISQVALVSAATVTNPCPNEYWEPVLDDNGVQVVNEGSIVCAPIPEAYKITCSPTGIELDIKYELMYDQVLDEQREEIGESLKIEPAKLGNCLNQADQEETSLDYRFQLRYDEKNENGDYCYVSF